MLIWMLIKVYDLVNWNWRDVVDIEDDWLKICREEEVLEIGILIKSDLWCFCIVEFFEIL